VLGRIRVKASNDVDVTCGFVVFCEDSEPTVRKASAEKCRDGDGDLSNEIISANIVVVEFKDKWVG